MAGMAEIWKRLAFIIRLDSSDPNEGAQDGHLAGVNGCSCWGDLCSRRLWTSQSSCLVDAHALGRLNIGRHVNAYLFGLPRTPLEALLKDGLECEAKDPLWVPGFGTPGLVDPQSHSSVHNSRALGHSISC